MANYVKELVVEFKKVSGWSNGPKKATIAKNTEGLDNNIIADIEDYIELNLPELSKGDSIQIILTVVESGVTP